MTARKIPRRRKALLSGRNLHHETLEKRELLAVDLAAETGPRLISVTADSGEILDLDSNNLVNVAPTELNFIFGSDTPIDPATLSGIQIVGSGGDGTFGDGNEIVIEPGFIGVGDTSTGQTVVARFAQTLADDQYAIEIAGFDDTDPLSPVVGLRNTDGELFVPENPLDPARPSQTVLLNVELGPLVVAVVPQPIDGVGAARTQLRDVVDVFFNNDPLSNPNAGAITSVTSTLPVVNPDFYQLVFTGDTIERTDDRVEVPTLVEYDPALNRARLTFAGGDLSDLADTLSGGDSGVGTFRLRIGSGEAIEVAGDAAPDVSVNTDDAGETFGNAESLAESLGVVFGTESESLVVADRAIQSVQDVVAPLPGAGDAVGLRENRRDALFSGRFDTITGIQTFEYNFNEFYGFDLQGNPLSNAVTPAQEQRVREIFDLLSERLGVSFVETESSGLQIAVGDLRVLGVTIDTGAGTPLLASSINELDPSEGLLILDGGENFFDGFGVSPDTRPSFFVEALRGVSNLLGLGSTFDAPAGDATGGSSQPESDGNAQDFLTPGLPEGLPVEPDFFTGTNIIAGQALLRPESNDVDLYRFTALNDGTLTAETFAQRLEDSSLLDTNLTLFQEINGEVVQIASNDDFFSEDSFLEIDLEVNRDDDGIEQPTTFFVAVTASGNEFDGDVEGSGFGGRSEGTYELRLNFVPEDQTGNTITDTTGSALDGDADGEAGGNFNFFFRVAPETVDPTSDQPRTIFVDALDGDDLNAGALDSPLSTIQAAFDLAGPDDIVRILPNGGADGDLATTADNVTFAIGTGGPGLQTLRDGDTFEVPQGVAVQIDAGAILKFQNAGISVGSSSADEDRSLGSLQILGTPQNSVTITSFNDASAGLDTNTLTTAPVPGDFAGIEFRNDIDFAEGLPVFESEGIFLDFVSHADIRFGGGSVSVSSPAVTPLQTTQRRPTFIFNTISDSAGAAISADPDSFLETTFNEPIFQRAGAFTSDFSRVGPEIFGNTLVNNAINGLFIRVSTPLGGSTEPQTVSGRFDDTDIVHVLSSALILQGQPGGPLLLEDRPDIQSFVFSDDPVGGSLVQGNEVQYRVTFVTPEGRESLASLPSNVATVGASGAVRIDNIPAAPDGFSGRRIYRINDDGSGNIQYDFIGQIDQSSTFFVDTGQQGRGVLPDAALAETRLLPRFDARLSIDPGTIVAIENGRIEAGFGSDFFAEGTAESPIIFTSLADDRFGAGGTFDTNNDPSLPQPGDFEGLIFRQDSTGSLDFVTVNFAGGGVASGTGFLSSNAVEILQADVRITNSSFEFNADGVDGADGISSTREGRGFNSAGTIFVRGSQPVILNNEILNNEGPAISINADALDFTNNLDTGRSTGPSDIIVTDQSNQGPLIEGNSLANNAINGLVVRGEVLQTEVVFDDTDIVHVVTDDIVTGNVSFRGGLRLRSDPDQSLVVAFDQGASLIGSGELTEIIDRVGGTLQIIGQPGFPVILTSINDDTAGAGFTPGGLAQTDTNNSTDAPVPGDFGGVVLSQFVNDRNVAFVLENEPANAASINQNAIADDAQVIGILASDIVSSDENQRLGFNVRGTLAADDDFDVFSFQADGGTTVFVDIDDTTFGLDTLVELIDANDNVLASSDNSFAEETDPSSLFTSPSLEPGTVRPLLSFGPGLVETGNPLDAGFQITLPGTSAGTDYFLRVRSANGNSSGQYQLSVRLSAADEIAGSTVQGADIRFANNAITVSSTPQRSPLLDTASENLNFLADGTPIDVDAGGLAGGPGSATDLGNLLTSDTGSLTVTGNIGNFNPVQIELDNVFPEEDVDFFRVDLFNQDIAPDLFDNEIRFVTTSFDVDFADGVGRPNTTLSVFNQFGQLILVGRDSSIADDNGRPLEGDDFENLSAGSAGALDPFIGPVELPEGTYFVAVSSAVAVPEALNQFFEPDPTAPLVRSVPINSVRAVSNSTASPDGGGISNFSAEAPAEVPIFDPALGGANESVVEFSLSDARLFVSFDGGLSGQNDNTLAAVNPFTGVVERLIGQSAQPLGDIAARRDGELLAFTLPDGDAAVNNDNTGRFLNLSPIDSSADDLGDDGIVFQENNDDGTDTVADDGAQFLANGIAFPLAAQDGQIQTINTTTIQGGERFFAIGDRDNVGSGVSPLQTRNLLFEFVSQDGEVTSQGSTDGDADRDFADFGDFGPEFGAGTTNVETGIVDTGDLLGGPGDGGDFTGIGLVPSIPPGLGAPVGVPLGPNNGNDTTTLIGVTDRGGVFFFNTNDAIGGPAGTPAAGLPNVIPTTFLGTVLPDPSHVNPVTDPTTGGVVFTGLAFGPRSLGDSAFRQTLFATTTDGFLYALEIDGDQVVPANILVNGQSAIPLTFQGMGLTGRAPNGLAFSNLEENIFDPSPDPVGGAGRGIEATFDNSRVDGPGGNSFFFGFEVDGTVANNTIARPDDDPLGELSPGGAQGQLISRPFSLEDFGPGDQPTLFFTYDISVEGEDDFLRSTVGTPARQQNDSLRVFVAGDDGQFHLVATNNNFRNPDGIADEFDEFATNGGIAVQELFDDGDGFRQARIDLSPFAGDENVRIRFEFSTSGNFQNNFNSFELVAVDGDRITDGESLVLAPNTTVLATADDNVVIESVVGLDLVLPASDQLQDGDFFTVVSSTSQSATITFVDDVNAGPGEISLAQPRTAEELALAVIDAVPAFLRPVHDGGGQISFLGGLNVFLSEESNISLATPIAFGLPQVSIPDGGQISIGDTLTFSLPSGLTQTLTFTDFAGFTGAPGQVPFVPASSGIALLNQILPILDPEFGGISVPSGIVGTGLLQLGLPTISVFSSNTNFATSSAPATVESFNLPSGGLITDGDSILFVSDFPESQPSVEIILRDSTVVPPLTPLADNEVLFNPTDDANTIAANLFARLPASLGAIIVDGSEIAFPSGGINPVKSFASDTLLAGNQVSIAETTRTLLSLPTDLTELSAAGSVTLQDVDGDNFVLTFTEFGFEAGFPTAPGAATISFTGTSTANTVANLILGQLPAQFQASLNQAGDGILIDGSLLGLAGPITASDLSVSVLAVEVANGSELTDGEQLVLENDGASLTITFVEGVAPVPAPPATVFFTAADSADDVAQSLIAVIGGFVSTELVTTDPSGTPIPPQINLLTAGATAQVVASSITIESVDRSRFSIGVADGDAITDGSVVTFFDPVTDAPFEITFVEGDTAGADEVNFEADDDSDVILQRLLAALPPSFRATLSADGNDILFFSSPTAAVPVLDPDNVISAPTNVPVLNVGLPAGSELRSGQTLVLDLNTFGAFDFPETVVTFVQTGGLPPDGVGTGPVVFFDSTDTADDIANSLIATLATSVFQPQLAPDVDLDGSPDGVDFENPLAVATSGLLAFFDTDNASLNTRAVPLTVPSGDELIDGEVLSLVPTNNAPVLLPGGNTITSAFGLNDDPVDIFFVEGPVGTPAPPTLGFFPPGQPLVVNFMPGDSAEVILQRLINTIPSVFHPLQSGTDRLLLINTVSTQISPGSAFIGFEATDPNAVPLLIDSAQASEQVAVALQDALVAGFGRQTPTGNVSETVFPVISGDRFRIFNSLLVQQGSFGASIFNDTIGAEMVFTSTPVEEFGEARPIAFTTAQINTNAADGNVVQGVFIDDIIVGSTERGELILNAPANNFNFDLDPAFIPQSRFIDDPGIFPTMGGVNEGRGFQPEFPNEILSGGFTLEVRTADEFGVERDLFPESLTLDSTRGLGRSFDANDRLVDGAVSLIAPAGINLIDGDTFVIDNGIDRLTFEFDSGDGVTAGNVPVAFDPFSTLEGETASAIRDAFNSPQAFQILGIRASTGDGVEVGLSNSARVELFGDEVRVNPGDGRFIVLDLVAEETFSGRATSRLFPVIDHEEETVVDANFGSTQAQAAVTGFFDGDTDVLVAAGRIGDEVLIGENNLFDGPTIIDTMTPQNDQDFVRIFLEAGQSVDIDVDATNFTRGSDVLLPLIGVFNDESVLLAQSLPLDGLAAPGEVVGDAFLQFTAPADGFYVVGISSVDMSTGDYQLTIRPSGPPQQVTIPESATGASVDGTGFFLTVDQVVREFVFAVDTSIILDPDQVLVPVAAGDDSGAIAAAVSVAVATEFAGQVTSIAAANVVSIEPDNVLPPITLAAPGVTEVDPFGTGTIPTSSVTLEFSDDLDPAELDGGTLSVVSPAGVPTVFQFVDGDAIPGTPVASDNVSVTFFSSLFVPGASPGGLVAAALTATIGAAGLDFLDGIGNANTVVLQRSPVGELILDGGNSAVELSGGPLRDILGVDYQFGRTDANRVNDQGQLIIANNIISDAAGVGILATSGDRGQGMTTQGTGAVLPIVADDLPRPGVAGLTANENTGRLVPGTVISNNLIVNPGTDGILFSGGTANNGESPAAIPIGRIVNNTVVSEGTGTGITVIGNASPTLLNNLVSGFALGVSVDPTSQDAGTVVAGNAFNDNATNANIPLSGTDLVIVGDVFEDPDRGVFIPVAGSAVIDSSFSALNDRPEFFETVTDPIGISASPIIAPTFDVFGQPRFNDPTINPPGASGEIITIDRGAVDRADFTAPIAVLTTPEDAVGTLVPGGDQDGDESFVLLESGIVEFFEIQLLDPAGTGIDPATVTTETVTLTENGTVLVPGVDFIFGFDNNNNTIRLTATAGQFLPDAVYEITLNNLSRTEIELLGGSAINDGDQVTITDNDGNVATFEFDSGFSVEVPQTTLLTVTGPNSAFNDGDVFSITGNGLTVNFEINTFGTAAPNNVAVDLTGATTITEVRDAILAVLQSTSSGTSTIAEDLGLAPVAVGLSQIQLGTVTGTIGPNAIDGFEVDGVAGGIVDAQSFTLESDGNLQTFEFDSDGDVAPGATPIPIAATDTPSQIAAAIVEAVNLSPLNSAVIGGEGIAVLGGNVGDQLDVTNSLLVASGDPGVAESLTLTIPDVPVSSLVGTTFSITVDGNEQEFLFSTDPNLVSTTSQVIVLDPAFAPEEIAAAIVPFIQAAIPSLNPTSEGAAVLIGESTTTPAVVDPGTAGLAVTGISGGAIPVSFLSTSSATSTAGALNGAIDSVVSGGGLNVNPFAVGGGTILIDNAADITFTGEIASVVAASEAPAVADFSGNPVLANRGDAETQFTIIFPEVTLDFGDAPDSFGTTLAANGPRNTIVSDGPGLGVLIDSESDGVPTDDSTGDDAAIDVEVTTSAGSPFVISTLGDVTTVTLGSFPDSGQTLTVNVASEAQTFELVELSENPGAGNIAVFFSPASTVQSITASLVAALSGAIDQVGDGLAISQVGNMGSLTITAIDDEDSILTGVNAEGIPVFLSSSTVDPANPDPSDVTGFFNVADPMGTNVEVLVRGTGLLQIFVDFNGNGIFEDNEAEHPISNLAVTGDLVTGTPVTVNIPTPASAELGETTLRVRISEQGDIGPDGVAIGGETEDFAVFVSDVPVPLPAPAGPFTILEDTVLSSAADPDDTVLPLMTLDPAVTGFFLLVEQAANGTVEIDPVTGDFTFTPDADFSGTDTFAFTVGLAPPSAPAGQVEPVSSMAAVETVTITVEEVNDVPPIIGDVTFGDIVESPAAGVGIPFSFTADDVLTQAAPISFGPSNAQFSVVGFAIPSDDAATPAEVIPFGQTGTLFVQSQSGAELNVGAVVTGGPAPDPAEGGFFELNFQNGAFVDGLYHPPADFNSAFAGVPTFDDTLISDLLSFIVADDTGTPDNLDDDVFSDPGTITFTVAPTNDAPSFDFTADAAIENGVPTANIFEDTDTTIENFVINVAGGPTTAIDEQAQPVIFSIDPGLNVAAINSGLINGLPTISLDGTLSISPAPDQVGTVEFVATALDVFGATTNQTFAVNIRAVNDPPQFTDDLGIANPGINSPDDQFSVAADDFDGDGQIDDATITFTLREDDALPGGANGPGFFIPLTTEAAIAAGVNRIGLLDVFNVGPADEGDSSLPAGNQFIEIVPDSVGLDGSALGPGFRTTTGGGILEPVEGGFLYRPPQDATSAFGFSDSFTYQVIDDNPGGGESLNLAGEPIDDQQVSTNQVVLVVNPVNDAPEFVPAFTSIVVDEDSATFTELFAPIFTAGPSTAIDENSPDASGQNVSFNVEPLDFSPIEGSTFFTQLPTIDSQTGIISFQPAPNAFGDFEFEVTLVDDGPADSSRGDVNTSDPVTLTISVNPINDPPILNPAADPLVFSVLEDTSIEIPIEGSNGVSGILDAFLAGPANELENVVGGNQTVFLGTPLPVTSAQQGTVTIVPAADGTQAFQYIPPANFVGIDTFIFTIVDNGTSVGPDGIPLADPDFTSAVVTLNVLPVNDAPVFGNLTTVSADEDQGPVSISNFVTGAFVGPTSAADEINGTPTTPAQTPTFEVTQVSGESSLFETSPFVVLDAATGTGSLEFTTAPEASGSATFELVLFDDGPDDASNGDQTVSVTTTFTIDVAAVNDPPSADLILPTVTVDEDSGFFSGTAFNNILAGPINPDLPGPSDEEGQIVTFNVELEPGSESLFAVQPTISSSGILQFTPATNQSTSQPVVLTVTAQDNLGAVADSVEITISITEVNDPPQAVADEFTIDEDSILTITVAELLGNDFDADLLTSPDEVLTVVLPAEQTLASGAIVTFDSSTGIITYDPTNAPTLQALNPENPGGALFLDQFSYSVVDSSDQSSNFATVAVSVEGINDAPESTVVPVSLGADGTATVEFPLGVTDVDSELDPSSVLITLQPSFGTVQVLPTGDIVYTPFGDLTTTDVFQFSVADQTGVRGDVGTVQISANAAPVAVDDLVVTFVDESIIIDVAANDVDADNDLDASSVVVVSSPISGSATVQADGTIEFTPTLGFVGTQTFTYQISDANGVISNVATVSVQINASRLQNPQLSSDVNDDGFVSPLDALLIINALQLNGNFTVTPDSMGPGFFDTSGDLIVTPLDALTVINDIIDFNSTSFSATALSVADEPVVAAAMSSVFSSDSVRRDPVVEIAADDESLVDVTAQSESLASAIDLIAADTTDQEDADEDDDSVSAVDAVLLSFSDLNG